MVQVFDPQPVGLSEIIDMNGIADTGAVRRGIIGSEDFQFTLREKKPRQWRRGFSY